MKKLLAISLFVLTACGEDIVIDIRDQAIGTYNYRIKAYSLSGTTLTYLGSQYDETGTYVVEKKGNTSFLVKEGGDEFFTGEKIGAASNGFTFDLPDQTFTDADGDEWDFEGYAGYELGGVDYHGAFESQNRRLVAWAKLTLQGGTGTIVIEVTGTKI